MSTQRWCCIQLLIGLCGGHQTREFPRCPFYMAILSPTRKQQHTASVCVRPVVQSEYYFAECASVLCIQLWWLYLSFLAWTGTFDMHICLMLESFVVLSSWKTQGKLHSVFKCWSTVNEIKCSTIFLHSSLWVSLQTKTVFCIHTQYTFIIIHLGNTGLKRNTWSQVQDMSQFTYDGDSFLAPCSL